MPGVSGPDHRAFGLNFLRLSSFLYLNHHRPNRRFRLHVGLDHSRRWLPERGFDHD